MITKLLAYSLNASADQSVNQPNKLEACLWQKTKLRVHVYWYYAVFFKLFKNYIET